MTFTEANRTYFDKQASMYDDRFAGVIQTLSEQTIQRRHWISDRWTDTAAGQGQEIRALDYAAGPGYISMTLAPYLSKVIGIDLSPNMVARYNSNAHAAGLSSKMIGYQADLISEPPSTDSAAWKDVDLLIISMALHHFEFPGQALQKLGQRVKQGGVCFIIDIMGHSSPQHHHHGPHGEDQGSRKPESPFKEFKEASATIQTHGFVQEDMAKLFREAGFESPEYLALEKPLEFTMDGQTVSMTAFMAKAKRA
ncbi:hypothetical protein N7468_010422 [Penicillium chermesinum]|uniref:Methyltransferase type 11 domain-containing protein n=1 Tax=Penicillium chermesinum TaxID=63820 RepID=A0A9W9TCI3_9EURO|nr:uncharacterized protein N7468_010422 [Penicillium chermesinum]KAJ5217414.1 hypothetical protein N7468_010422 [Penicillium chermesinum]